ncbi:alpha/beta hydrolase [Niabella aquatica]
MKCTFVLSFLLFSVTAFTQKEIPLYENEIPNNISADNIEKYVKRDYDADWVSDVSVPTLTFYPVAGALSPVPAVLICPGGGYGGLSIIKEGADVAKEFNRYGIAAFVLKYRLPGDRIMKDKSIGPLQDAQQALMLIRKNAEKWKVDPKKVGIAGFSAGGHLASTAGTHFQQPVIDNKGISVRPDFMVLAYPVISFTDSLTHWGSRENLIGKNASKEQVILYSNELQVTENTPPAFIVHAGDDKVVKVENSTSFYLALNTKGVFSDMLLYPQGGHGFGLHNRTTSDKWMEHCILWLTENIFKKDNSNIRK